MNQGAVRIRTAAARLGTSQKGIAEALGLSSTAVYKWWHGKAVPPRERCVALEDALQIPRGELLVAFGFLPDGEATIHQADGEWQIVVRVPGGNPGYLNSEPLFDPDPFLVAA